MLCSSGRHEVIRVPWWRQMHESVEGVLGLDTQR